MDVDSTGLFKSEQPDPIQMSNGKRKRSNSGGRKRSNSAKKKSGIGKGISQLQKTRPMPKVKPASAKPKLAPEWNDQASKSKYFDPSIDPKEKRALENDEKKQIREARATL